MTGHPRLKAVQDLPALLAACALPADLRPWPVVGDQMAPRLKRGDFILCRPVDCYVGDRTYVMMDGAIADAQRSGRTARMSFANKRYAAREVSAAWFDFNVLAYGVQLLQCWDPAASDMLRTVLLSEGRARA